MRYVVLMAVAVGLFLFATGCGGGGETTVALSTPDNAAPEAAQKDRTSDNTNETTKKKSGASEATCRLKGKRKADVTLEYTAEGFDLAFKGQPVPSSGSALYSAIVFDKTGEYGVQLGMKYLNGEQIGYFIFSFDTNEQTNLGGTATVDGDVVSGRFPTDELGQLAEAGGPASWSAAFNLQGNDVGECPGGIDSLPFPD